MSGATGAYVGPSDVHEATIVGVEREGSALLVRLRSDEGRSVVLRFSGVTDVVCSPDVSGHRIHALMEVEADDPPRFVFVPWDAAEAPKLEVRAQSFGELAEDG